MIVRPLKQPLYDTDGPWSGKKTIYLAPYGERIEVPVMPIISKSRIEVRFDWDDWIRPRGVYSGDKFMGTLETDT